MLQFLQISMSFFSVPVLKNISFTVPSGQTLGLVGESGARFGEEPDARRGRLNKPRSKKDAEMKHRGWEDTEGFTKPQLCVLQFSVLNPFSARSFLRGAPDS
jgi:ABC-type microcin C transport system duplicated ATPase subunit YejF